MATTVSFGIILVSGRPHIFSQLTCFELDIHMNADDIEIKLIIHIL